MIKDGLYWTVHIPARVGEQNHALLFCIMELLHKMDQVAVLHLNGEREGGGMWVTVGTTKEGQQAAQTLSTHGYMKIRLNVIHVIDKLRPRGLLVQLLSCISGTL